ncbi:hypothetical protein R3Q08_26830 [Rhodococcus erythropolis]|uniref:hypothetical protein n=1 Tax=Rhodococcus erythropolis TaxID=1833 RepID=UPI002949B980|nr:hypothetical protein [Rhodococcus erythropolis]MDV6211880.1 hypothetical protein [Rhodococcus erythropolis]
MTPVVKVLICILIVGAVARMSAAVREEKWIGSADFLYGLGAGFLAALALEVD